MPSLIHCVNCSQPVSSEATTCPNCGKSPQPYRPHSAPRPASYAQDEYTCPACRTVLSPETFRFKFNSVMGLGSESIDSPVSCPTCGHLIQVRRCAYCDRGIFDGTGKSVLRLGGYMYYHSSCFMLVPEDKRREERAGDSSNKQGCASSVLIAVVVTLTAALIMAA